MEGKNRIDLLLPDSSGGVRKWGEDLVKALYPYGFSFRVFRGKREVISYLFTSHKSPILHSTVPLPWRSRKVRMVLSIHGLFKKEKNLWSGFYPHTINLADKVTVPSQWLKKELGLTRCYVVPNGIFLPPRIQYPAKNLSKKKKIVFLTITNFNFFEKCKGIELIYKALKNISHLKKNFVWYILGEGKFRRDFEEKIKSKSNLKVLFKGFKPAKIFYRKADIFLYYSFLDTFALVLLEAMSYGLPVVTNNFGPAHEIITDARSGFIINHPGEMSKVVKMLIYKNGLREKVIKSGRVRAEKYDWKKIALYWKNLYHSLLQSR